MAFATTNVVRENAGSVNVVRGNWSASVGDAAGTITVGSVALDAEFHQNLSSGPYQNRIPTSGLGTNVVTVYHLGAVTNGTFTIRFK